MTSTALPSAQKSCNLKQITSHARLVEFQWSRGLWKLLVNFYQYANFLKSVTVDKLSVNVDGSKGRMVHRITDLKKLLHVPYE